MTVTVPSIISKLLRSRFSYMQRHLITSLRGKGARMDLIEASPYYGKTTIAICREDLATANLAKPVYEHWPVPTSNTVRVIYLKKTGLIRQEQSSRCITISPFTRKQHICTVQQSVFMKPEELPSPESNSLIADVIDINTWAYLDFV